MAFRGLANTVLPRSEQYGIVEMVLVIRKAEKCPKYDSMVMLNETRRNCFLSKGEQLWQIHEKSLYWHVTMTN